MVTRELTPEQHQERAEVCYALHQQVKEGLRSSRDSAWKLAQALSEWDEAAGWSAIGYEALGDWLADPEIGITKSVYYRLVKGYRTLSARHVPEAQMLELDPSKVDVVIGAVQKGRATLEDALEDVKELGWRDLREKYLGKRPTDDEPLHELPPDEPLVGEVIEEPAAEEAVEEVVEEVVEAVEHQDAQVADAWETWLGLRNGLLEVAERGRGQDRPRLPNAVAAMIEPGIAAADELFDRLGIDGERLAA